LRDFIRTGQRRCAAQNELGRPCGSPITLFIKDFDKKYSAATHHVAAPLLSPHFTQKLGNFSIHAVCLATQHTHGLHNLLGKRAGFLRQLGKTPK